MFEKTRKNKHYGIVWLTGIVFLLLLSVVVYIFYNNFFSKQQFYLSPLASQKESPVDKIKNALEKASIPFAEVVASGSAYAVFLGNEEEVILTFDDKIEKRIYSLQLMLKQFTIEGKKFKQIDFRFDKPVVLF